MDPDTPCQNTKTRRETISAMVKYANLPVICNGSSPSLPGKTEEIEAGAQEPKSSNILSENRRIRGAPKSSRKPQSDGMSPTKKDDPVKRDEES